jgi:hypothetical protein
MDLLNEVRQLFEEAFRTAQVPPKKWLTRKEAADLAGLSLRTIDDRVKNGIYTISKAPGKTCRVYILRTDVERLIEKNRHVRTPYKPHVSDHVPVNH